MSEQSTRRCIGLDVHRDFAQVAIWQDGVVSQAGRFATTPEGVRAFAAELGPADEVSLEATGNTGAIAALLASRAGRVVVSNPVKTRAIAEAKVKTDKVGAEILSRLLAADFLPPAWIKRRRWLAEQQLPPDEQTTALALLRQLDFQGEELALIDGDHARAALGRDDVARLMSIPGVDAIVALLIVAAVGDVTRFRTPDKLVCYFGLNPRVRQSGGHPAGTRPATHG